MHKFNQAVLVEAALWMGSHCPLLAVIMGSRL